jgi:hypothetical protein
MEAVKEPDQLAWVDAIIVAGCVARAKRIAEARDVDAPVIDSALALVRAFIAERRLVIYGGMAIDFAFRLRGAQLYEDDARPDYDFISPDNVADAYELGRRLHGAGYAAVGVMRGVHPLTMRVRVDGHMVADITYAPADVYDAIPALEWPVKGARPLRFVHPDYQRLDLHRAFSLPYAEAPREVITHRARKDLGRLNRLAELWPLAPPPAPKQGGEAPPKARPSCSLPSAVALGWDTTAVTGWLAYAALIGDWDAMHWEEFDWDSDADDGVCHIGTFPTGLRRPPPDAPADCHTAADPFLGGPVHYLTADPSWAESLGPNSVKYEPYMDYFFESVRSPAATVFSTERQLSVTVNVAVPNRGELRVAGVHTVLTFLLLGWHRAAPAWRPACLACYARLFAAAGAAAPDSPLTMATDPLGAHNISDGYAIIAASRAAALREAPPADLNLGLDAAGAQALLAGLPPPLYFDRARPPPPPFAYEAPLFRRSGKPVSVEGGLAELLTRCRLDVACDEKTMSESIDDGA